jgi:hypothetical protein
LFGLLLFPTPSFWQIRYGFIGTGDCENEHLCVYAIFHEKTSVNKSKDQTHSGIRKKSIYSAEGFQVKKHFHHTSDYQKIIPAFS